MTPVGEAALRAVVEAVETQSVTYRRYRIGQVLASIDDACRHLLMSGDDADVLLEARTLLEPYGDRGVTYADTVMAQQAVDTAVRSAVASGLSQIAVAESVGRRRPWVRRIIARAPEETPSELPEVVESDDNGPAGQVPGREEADF